MSRKIAIAGALVALFFAGSFAVIARVTAPAAPAPAAAPVASPGEPAAPPAPEARVAATTAALTDPAMAAVTLRRDAAGRPLDLAPPPAVPAPAPTARPAWLEGATRTLGPRPDPTPLGPLRPYVASAMSRLQVSVAACAQEAPPAEAAAPVARGKTTLLLHLETLDNQLRIADATPADGAAADDWRVRCAQRKLRGQTIYAPSRAGAPLRVPFELRL